jgi:hypothetical protein
MTPSLGWRLDGIKAWLDENCGANGSAITPSGTRGLLNDALSIYLVDATLASAFVARWCAGYSIETAGGVFTSGVFRPASDHIETKTPSESIMSGRPPRTSQ